MDLNTKPPAFLQVEERGPRDGLVTSWSYSRLDKYESCAYSIYLTSVEKAPRVDNEAAVRGQKLHDMAEQFVDGTLDELPKELAKHYKQSFYSLADKYQKGKVSLEGEWGITTNWEPTGWLEDDTWGRIKLDAFVEESPTSGRVIDYKSGKPYPIKHNQQGQIYAITAFIYYPQMEYLETEFWYLDKTPQPAINRYTREQAMMFLPKWDERAKRLTMARHFPPSPSVKNCRFCDHAKTETCPYRVV